MFLDNISMPCERNIFLLRILFYSGMRRVPRDGVVTLA